MSDKIINTATGEPLSEKDNNPIPGSNPTLDTTAKRIFEPDSEELPVAVEKDRYNQMTFWERDIEDNVNIDLGEDLNGNRIIHKRDDIPKIAQTKQAIINNKELFKHYAELTDDAVGDASDQYSQVALNKSSIEKLAGGLGQMSTNFVSGFLGAVGSWDLSDGVGMLSGEQKQYGNMFQDWADKVREFGNENFKTWEVEPGGINPGDMGWWASQLGQFGTSLGFMAESAIETVLVGWLTGGAGLTASIAKGVNTARRLRKIAAAGKLQRLLKGTKLFKPSTQQLVKAGTYGAFKGAQEGIIEGYESFNSTFQKYIDKGLTPKEAQKLASIAATTTYREGVIPLMVLNSLQYATMSVNPLTGKTSSRILSKINNNTLRGATEFTTQTLSEGVEELIQGFAQQSGEDAAAFEAGDINKGGIRSIGEKLGDNENLNAFIGGMLGGMAFSAGGYAMSYKDRKQGKLDKKTHLEKTGELFKTLKKHHEAVNKLTEVGKYDEAQMLQRKSGLAHTAALLDMDMQFDRESGYEGVIDFYETAIEAAKKKDKEKLNELGVSTEDLDYVVKSYSQALKDSKEFKKNYEEALEYNDPRFAKDIATQKTSLVINKEFEAEANQRLEEYVKTVPGFSEINNPEIQKVLNNQGKIHNLEKTISNIIEKQKTLKVSDPSFPIMEKQKEELLKEKQELEVENKEIVEENSSDSEFDKSFKEQLSTLNKLDKRKYFDLLSTKEGIKKDNEFNKKELAKISDEEYQKNTVSEADFNLAMISTDVKSIAKTVVDLEAKGYLEGEKGSQMREKLASRITDLNSNSLSLDKKDTKKDKPKVQDINEEDKTEVQKEVEKVADLKSIERKNNEKLINEAIKEVNEKIEKNKEAKSEVEETLIILDLILDDALFNSKEKVDALVDKLDGMKLLNKKIKGAIKTRLSAISKESNKEVRDQLQAEFKLANQATSSILEFKKELEQLENIEKDLLKQVDYYKNLIANKNLTTLDLNDLEKVQDKLERKISTVRKLIKGIKDAINQTKQYLKEYFKSLKKALPEGTNVDEVLKSVDNISEMTPEELSELIEKQNTLEERAIQALEGVVNSEEMAEVESKRRQELEEALTKYDNQLRYLNELIDKAILADEVIKKEIKEDIAEIKGKPELTEKQKETQEILIDVIENSRKFGDPETVDGKSFYKKGKELFERVSNYIANKFGEKQITKENEAAKKGQAVGNFVDFIGRDIFKGEVVSRETYIKETNDYNQDKGNTYLLTDSSVSQEVFDSLVKIFTDTKNHLEKTGHTFLSDDMTVSSPIKEAIGKANGVAGTLDLIAINKEGVVQIIDFKNIVFNGSLTNTQHLDKIFTKTSNWTPKAEQWARQQTMYKRLLELAGLTVDTVNVLPISTEYKAEGNVITISKVKPLHKRKEEGYGLTKTVDKEGKYKISNLSENIIELEEHERTNDIMDNDFGTNEVIQEDFTQVIEESLFGNIEGAIPNQEIVQETTNQEIISEQDVVETKSLLDNMLNDPSGYIYSQEELDTLVDEGVLEKDCD